MGADAQPSHQEIERQRLLQREIERLRAENADLRRALQPPKRAVPPYSKPIAALVQQKSARPTNPSHTRLPPSSAANRPLNPPHVSCDYCSELLYTESQRDKHVEKVHTTTITAHDQLASVTTRFVRLGGQVIECARLLKVSVHVDPVDQLAKGIDQLTKKFRDNTPRIVAASAALPKKPPEKRTECEFCHQSFKASNLARHLVEVHGSIEASRERESERKRNRLLDSVGEKEGLERKNLLRGAQGGLPSLGKNR